MDKKNIPENIDAYIAGFPLEIQQIMSEVRNVIRETAPEATEGISWAMPTFPIKKILVQSVPFDLIRRIVSYNRDKLTGK